MAITLQKIFVVSLIFIVAGAMLFALTVSLGWRILDGIAGGPRSNSHIEDLLAICGSMAITLGILLLLVGIIIWIIKRLRRQ